MMDEQPVIGGRQPGRIELEIAVRNGRSVPLVARATPPLQLSRVRYDTAEPTAAALTMLQLGGILAGDDNSIDIAVGSGAAAHLCGAASTQVLAMPHGTAAQRIAATLGDGAMLAWMPEPTILFGRSSFAQSASIVLPATARLAWLDVLVPGRLARGEVHQYHCYESRLTIARPDGRPLVAERFRLQPFHTSPVAAGRLGDTPVVGSLYMLGFPSPAMLAEHISSTGDPLLAATVLSEGCGVLVRALGTSGSAVQGRLLRWWRAVETADRAVQRA